MRVSWLCEQKMMEKSQVEKILRCKMRRDALYNREAFVTRRSISPTTAPTHTICRWTATHNLEVDVALPASRPPFPNPPLLSAYHLQTSSTTASVLPLYM